MEMLLVAYLYLVAIASFLSASSSKDTKELLEELKDVLDVLKVDKQGDVISERRSFSRHKQGDISDLDRELEELIQQYNLTEDISNVKGTELNDDRSKFDDIVSFKLNPEQLMAQNKEKEKMDKEVLAAFSQAEERKKREGDECVDAAGIKYCYTAAFRGQCNTHPEDMKVNCKRSCKFCCADDPSYLKHKICERAKKYKACEGSDSLDKMRILCPKTCQFCGRASIEIPCVRSQYGCCWDGSIAKGHLGTPEDKCPECKDSYTTLCKRFAQHCTDAWGKAGEQVRRWCPLTCRTCGVHKICRDRVETRDSCIQMKYDGTCNTFKLGMQYICPKTCDLCNYSTVDCSKTKYGCCGDGKSIAKGPYKNGCKECTDTFGMAKKCKSLDDQHHACKLNKSRMNILCPGTCKSCETR